MFSKRKRIRTKADAIKQFNKQIKGDKKYIIDKQLFNLTLDFSLAEWKLIRGEEYWEVYDTLSYDEKKIFTLSIVKDYIENYRNKCLGVVMAAEKDLKSFE